MLVASPPTGSATTTFYPKPQSDHDDHLVFTFDYFRFSLHFADFLRAKPKKEKNKQNQAKTTTVTSTTTDYRR